MSWLAYAQAGFAGHAFTWISPPAGHARHLGSQQWGVGRHGTLGIDQRWHFDLAARFGRTPDRPRRGKRGPARARSGDRTTRRRRGGNPRPDRRLAPAELAGRAAGLALAR